MLGKFFSRSLQRSKFGQPEVVRTRVNVRGAAMRHAPFGYFPARGKYLVRPQEDETSHKELISCGRQGKAPPCFFVTLRVSPLRRRPKGFPVALWKPSGFHPLRGMGATKNKFLVEGRGKLRLAFLVLHRVSLLHGNYDQTVNNRQKINKTAKFVDFSASPRDQSIARGWQKFL